MHPFKQSVLFIVLATAVTPLVAEDSMPHTAQQKAKALIGLEYVGGRVSMVQPSCTDDGEGGTLSTDTRTLEGWFYGNLYCQGKPVLALTKFLGYDGNLPRWRIVDAIVIPVFQRDDSSGGPGSLQFTQTGLCTLDGKRDELIVALVREGRQPKRNGEREDVAYSWGFDVKREKVIPISSKRVRCVHDEP